MLVLGDIQGASTADDVPPAARKALVDMREFLPFKSYKLLDAAWVLCCGQQGPGVPVDRRPVASSPSTDGRMRLTIEFMFQDWRCVCCKSSSVA